VHKFKNSQSNIIKQFCRNHLWFEPQKGTRKLKRKPRL